MSLGSGERWNVAEAQAQSRQGMGGGRPEQRGTEEALEGSSRITPVLWKDNPGRSVQARPEWQGDGHQLGGRGITQESDDPLSEGVKQGSTRDKIRPPWG